MCQPYNQTQALKKERTSRYFSHLTYLQRQDWLMSMVLVFLKKSRFHLNLKPSHLNKQVAKEFETTLLLPLVFIWLKNSILMSCMPRSCQSKRYRMKISLKISWKPKKMKFKLTRSQFAWQTLSVGISSRRQFEGKNVTMRNVSTWKLSFHWCYLPKIEHGNVLFARGMQENSWWITNNLTFYIRPNK